jgi:hypothetical protein
MLENGGRSGKERASAGAAAPAAKQLGTVATGDTQLAELVKSLGLVFGLLAGVVGLVYAVGGGVLAVRLYFESLPSLTVVGQLPREYLIAVGLTQVFLPVLAAAAIYFAVRMLSGSAAARPRRTVDQESTRSSPSWVELVGASALALVAILLGASPAIARQGLSEQLLVLLAAGFAITLVVMLVALKLRVEIAERETWSKSRATAGMALVIALVSLPAWVIGAGTFHFLDAKVCTTGGLPISGVLIGETSDRVYVGESNRRTSGPRRVVSIPLSQVEEVFIGGQAAAQRC